MAIIKTYLPSVFYEFYCGLRYDKSFLLNIILNRQEGIIYLRIQKVYRTPDKVYVEIYMNFML